MSGGITAVVVSKGLDALLDVCLEHLDVALRAAGRREDHGIVVVDNASQQPYDAARFRVGPVRCLRFDRPHSFASACNAGARARPGDWVLLLNNDVLLARGAVAEMRALLESEPRAGICGARLLFPDGTVQHAGVVFGAGGRGPYHADRGRPARLVPRLPTERQAVTGACLLARRSLWDELGGLDTAYPFGLEDIDLCLRARREGWRVLCANGAESLHFESMTPGRVELDVPSRRLFMERWRGRYTLDG